MTAPLNRRAFISAAGAAAGGVVLFGLGSGCGAGSTEVSPPGPVTGSVRGTVVNMDGALQGIGRVFLLQKTGLNTGVHADVDASGHYNFGDVEVGSYLLRFWGGNLGHVPEPLPNPIRITVAADTPVVVQFRVLVGLDPDAANEREIYIGDFFFQEQPAGATNGTVVVKAGTLVCWYNVGRVLHNVAGGPWGESGPIGLDGNFMWTADRVGTFSYRCSYHGTQMLATLQIVP